MAKKIWSLESKEDIQKWIEERKKYAILNKKLITYYCDKRARMVIEGIVFN